MKPSFGCQRLWISWDSSDPATSQWPGLAEKIDEKYLKNIICINYICCDPLSRKPLQNLYPSPDADTGRREEAVEIWKFIWKFNFSFAVKIFNITILKEHFKSFPVPRRLRKCILSELTNKMKIYLKFWLQIMFIFTVTVSLELCLCLWTGLVGQDMTLISKLWILFCCWLVPWASPTLGPLLRATSS